MLNVGLVAPITLDVVQATPPPSHFHGVRVADPAMPAKPCVAGSIPAGGTILKLTDIVYTSGPPSDGRRAHPPTESRACPRGRGPPQERAGIHQSDDVPPERHRAGHPLRLRNSRWSAHQPGLVLQLDRRR